MFTLLFERRDRVMLTRYSRMYSWDDISEIDAFLASFVTEHGYVRIILDFTDVETIAISRQRLGPVARRYGRTPAKLGSSLHHQNAKSTSCTATTRRIS
jgi:hypothetical protein